MTSTFSERQDAKTPRILIVFFFLASWRLGVPPPFGDLRFTFPGHEAATDYRRELDLDTAVARVTYHVADVVYTREIFASYPDHVIVARISASKPHQLNFTVKLDSPHKGSIVKSP